MVTSAGTVAGGLRRTFTVLVSGLIVAAGAGIIPLVFARRAIDDFSNRIRPLEEANEAILRSILDAETGVRGFALTGDDRFLEPYRSATFGFPAAATITAAQSGGDEALKQIILEQTRIGNAWFDEFAEPVIAARRIDPAQSDAIIAEGDGRLRVDEIRDLNDQANERIGAKRQARIDQVRRLALLSGLAFLAIIAIALVAVGRQAQRLRHGLTVPLNRLHGTLRRLEGGDLSARASLEGFTDVRSLSEAINSMAIENQNFVAANDRQLERERLERQIGSSILKHLDTEGVAKLATKGLGQALKADRARLRLFDSRGALGPVVSDWYAASSPPSKLRQAAAHPDITRQWVNVAGGLPDPVAIDDVANDDRLTEDLRNWLVEDNIGSAIFGTIRVDQDQAVAALAIYMLDQPRAWTEDDLELVRVVTSDIATALLHARLLEQERSMVNRLQELDQVKSDFVSSVSHELRTPLTSIIGYLEMLREGDAGAISEEQAKMLGIVARNADRLLDLIEDLLTLSRIESGRFKPTMAPLDLAAVVDGAVEAVRPQVDSRAISLEIEAQADASKIMGDASQIERVLMNLLSNAIKFTPAGGLVAVRTRAVNADSVQIQVSDTGIGIPADEQSRLFTQFFRASTAQKEAIQGTGLGLAITKAIVENHYGSIAVESAPGVGTTFTVTLPRYSARLGGS